MYLQLGHIYQLGYCSRNRSLHWRSLNVSAESFMIIAIINCVCHYIFAFSKFRVLPGEENSINIYNYQMHTYNLSMLVQFPRKSGMVPEMLFPSILLQTDERVKRMKHKSQMLLLTFSCLQVCHVLKIAEVLRYSSIEIIGRQKPAKWSTN